MYLFNALTQKRIQLTGASRTSSQDMVSTVVGHSHAPQCLVQKHLPFPSPNPQHFHYSQWFSNIMFSVYCSSTLKRAPYQFRILVLFYVVMRHKLSVFFLLVSHSVFPVIVALHCPHLFHPQTQACSKFNVLHPKPTSRSIFFCFFLIPLNPSVLHAPHSSSVYPPQTALASSGGLYCLHGCAVNIWSALHCTAQLHGPCCVSTPLCSLLTCSSTTSTEPCASNCWWNICVSTVSSYRASVR